MMIADLLIDSFGRVLRDLRVSVTDRCNFRCLWKWDGAPAVIMSRAVDQTGYVQPDWQALQAVRGRRTRYHQNPITGWKIGADGQVLFAVERVS